tara:strand:- start:370 stop:1647 length:1278 start_codon:yes stop_codon:yes gene_type:complete
MKMIEKVPKTLNFIESKFKENAFYSNGKIEINNYDNDVYQTKVLTSTSFMYYYHLSNFLRGDKQGDIDLNFKNTLTIRYNKKEDVLSVTLKEVKLHKTIRDHKVKYMPNQELLFILNKKGCFRFISKRNKNIRKITFNSFLSSNNFNHGVRKYLLNELYDNICDRFPDLTYIPSELQNCKNEQEIRDKIDPDDILNYYKTRDILEVYSALTKKSFKEVLKYLKRCDFKKVDRFTASIINQYYFKRYPTFDDDNFVLSRLNFLIHSHKSNCRKIELPNHKNLNEYIEKFNDFNVTKNNNLIKTDLIKSTKGVKRLLDKLIKPNFKFTHEWIRTNEELKEVASKVGYMLIPIKSDKRWWLKVYIKGVTLLMSTCDYSFNGDCKYNIGQEYLKIIHSYFDKDVLDKLKIKDPNTISIDYGLQPEPLPF